MTETIKVGFQTFVSDSPEEFGAIREISRDGEQLTVYVENAGDFTVDGPAVKSSHDGKVVLLREHLSPEFLKAVENAHSKETE